MLRLAIQPPSQARPGSTLYPSVAAGLSSAFNIFEDLAEKWAVATLIDHTGEVLHDRLGGRVTDSAHPFPEGSHSSENGSDARRDRAYFFFPDLTIYEPGQYRIRISLMQMESSGEPSGDPSLAGQTVVCQTVETHTIVVEDGSPSRGHLRMKTAPLTSCKKLRRTGSHERAFLRIMEDDGQDVPSHDS